MLYAFDAKHLSEPMYTSEQNSKRDQAGMATRFVIPVVVNGHVYFGVRDEVEVYGLLKYGNWEIEGGKLGTAPKRAKTMPVAGKPARWP